MNFGFTEEQEELRAAVRRFFQDKSPVSEVRRLMETSEGYDPSVWSQMAGQLGLQALIVPEAYGGAGSSQVELAVVFEEMGRSLFCAPYFSTVALATNALLCAGDEAAKADYLPSIANGETIATVALFEEKGSPDLESIELTATSEAGGWRLAGSKHYVIDGHVASLVLVAGRSGRGLSLFAVERDARGLERTFVPTMDQTRKQARLDFDGTPARLVGEEGTATRGLGRMLDLALVSLAAEQVGGAEAVLEMSVEHAKHRQQFGRPIGSFQAIKHTCAEVLLEVESARSAAYYATWAAAEHQDELAMAASLAKAYCSEAYFHAAAENIQIHGGIGFTWEHDAHLYFKRATSSELLFGDPPYHRERLATLLGI